jgi:Sigma-54 interaction domain
MENHPSKVLDGVTPAARPLTGGPPQLKDWHLAREAQVSLLLMGNPRVNLLLVGIDAGVWNVLETLLLSIDKPVTTWLPGERLALPPPGRTGTLILHDVGTMTHEEQHVLLDWLDRAAGRTQVVSTTRTPLITRVKSGAFLDNLYYRLNTVCVDVTA